MGLMQSCLGKKNKVGVLSEEEEEAYGKMGKEMKKEMVDDIIKPQPWLMFYSEPGVTQANRDKGDGLCGTVTDLVEKKGGLAFRIEYKSTVPNCHPSMWQETKVRRGRTIANRRRRDKLLVEKHEQAKIRKENIIHQRITSARRPKTVGSRATYDFRRLNAGLYKHSFFVNKSRDLHRMTSKWRQKIRLMTVALTEHILAELSPGKSYVVDGCGYDFCDSDPVFGNTGIDSDDGDEEKFPEREA